MRESNGVWRSTTVLGLTLRGQTAMGGDGQVTFDDTIMKHTAQKVRRLSDGRVLAGFAGASADAFTLFERFETKLEDFSGNLARAAVELAKDWRMDKYLRRLEALLAVIDGQHALIISGNGDVIEPDDGIVAIGSGAPYAIAAARALNLHTKMNADQIVRTALEITADICVFTNKDITIEVL
ncbi:MAG: ATP-dependent protease subunit HslV [candidate division Zixibacteria bacterium]|nr:ATP-dependent protease subunit HslV [candidate division Zixibacteria bacterium]